MRKSRERIQTVPARQYEEEIAMNAQTIHYADPVMEPVLIPVEHQATPLCINDSPHHPLSTSVNTSCLSPLYLSENVDVLFVFHPYS